jgi:transposase IS116/IS110/IS902 family protein
VLRSIGPGCSPPGSSPRSGYRRRRSASCVSWWHIANALSSSARSRPIACTACSRCSHQITPPAGRLGNAGQPTWWEHLELPTSERLRVLQDLTLLQTVERLIVTVDAELTRLSTQDPWKELAPFLMHLPGFAVVTSMTLLAAIGDIARFPSAKKLVGYSGLGASVHASGQTYRTGPITKPGRRELRTVLVEAAWSAVDHHAHWHMEFERLVPSLGKGQAIVQWGETGTGKVDKLEADLARGTESSGSAPGARPLQHRAHRAHAEQGTRHV